MHRVFWIPVSLRDSLAVATLMGAPSFRVVSALQDFLAVEAFMVHRVFKGKSHFPTVSGRPLDSVRDASAVVEMVCSCRANPVCRLWFARASTSSCFVQGSPRLQASICRGICLDAFCLLVPPQLQKWSTSQPICSLLLLPLSRRKPYKVP